MDNCVEYSYSFEGALHSESVLLSFPGSTPIWFLIYRLYEREKLKLPSFRAAIVDNSKPEDFEIKLGNTPYWLSGNEPLIRLHTFLKHGESFRLIGIFQSKGFLITVVRES